MEKQSVLLMDWVPEFIIVFILPRTVNASYTRKDQNFYMGTINYFNGMSECEGAPFRSCNYEPVILLVYVFFSPQFYKRNQT